MFEAPAYLSPSSIGTFRDCPMKFKFSRIDRLSEPPTWAIHVGTFVHEVLEHFYQLDAHERTLESVKAMATERWKASDWETQVNELIKPEGTIVDFKRQAFECMKNLWKVEDPQSTELVGMEHEIDADIEVRASTAGEAEDIARAEWADHGLGADAVTVRRVEE